MTGKPWPGRSVVPQLRSHMANEPEAEKPQQPLEQLEKDDKWWSYAGWGVAAWALAGFQYWRLAQYEAGGDRVRLKGFEKFLYSIGGKWAVTIFLVALGALLVWYGISLLRKKRTE